MCKRLYFFKLTNRLYETRQLHVLKYKIAIVDSHIFKRNFSSLIDCDDKLTVARLRKDFVALPASFCDV